MVQIISYFFAALLARMTSTTPGRMEITIIATITKSQIVFHHRNIGEEIAGIGKRYYPQYRADDVVADESAVVHAAHACDKRSKRAHNRDEAGDDDGFAAVFFVEGMGFGQNGFGGRFSNRDWKTAARRSIFLW